MIISFKRVKEFNLSIVFLIAFSGYYAVLIILSNLDLIYLSRYFTIPARIVILGCLVLIYLQKIRFKLDKSLFYFIAFSLFYLYRIIIEYALGDVDYHISHIEFLLYYVSFVLLPILLISNIKLEVKDYKLIFIMMMLSSIIMSLSTILFYGDLIGEVSRINTVLAQDDIGYISPLSLSYSSAMTLGLCVMFLISNKPKKLFKRFIYVALVLSIFPFLIGASRGSILALIFPFVLYAYYSKNFNHKIKFILLGAFTLLVLFMITSSTGSGAFDRLFSLNEEINSGSSVRLDMWVRGLETFYQNPIFGSTLDSRFYNSYPHNIIIEILISTGILGIVPFLYFLFFIFKRISIIIKQNSEEAWLIVIFAQSLMQNMFSGSIYNASWFAIGAGLIIGYSKYFKTTK